VITILGMVNEGGRERFARHALGARFLDYIRSGADEATEWKNLGAAEECFIRHGGVEMRLVRQTEGKLNHCGEVLRPYLLEVADPRELIVAYDEAHYDLGESRLTIDGWDSNGHMGMESLIAALGADGFGRAAIGIGRIPGREGWEEFFNAQLDPEQIEWVEATFEALWQAIFEHAMQWQQTLLEVSSKVMLAAQIPGRVQNLLISPQLVRIPERQTQAFRKKLRILARIIQRTAKTYARLCHECADPTQYELVRALEMGVPEEMLPLVRGTQFQIEGMSFDFHHGKLMEINAAPLPPLVASQVRTELGLPGPGIVATAEHVCKRVKLLADRQRRAERDDLILLVSQIGGLTIGLSGWFEAVREHLEAEGYKVAIGSIEDYPEAGVIWANLTWMTPERWESVLTPKVWGGEAYVYPSPRNFLFTSKWFLTLLSSPYGRELMEIGPAEERVLDEIIPWTADLAGSRDTIRLLAERGVKLYGKPYLASGSRGGNTVSTMRHLQKVARPAVIQEWVDPYELGDGWRHDLRIVLYGNEGQARIWMARVWRDSQVIAKPMDSPVVFGR